MEDTTESCRTRSNANAAPEPKPKIVVASRYLAHFSNPTSTTSRRSASASPATNTRRAGDVATATAAATTRTLPAAFQSPTHRKGRSSVPPERTKSRSEATPARPTPSVFSSYDKRTATTTATATPARSDVTPRRASVDGGVNHYLRALSSPAAAASPSPRSVSSTSATGGTRSDRFAYSPGVASAPPVRKRSLLNGLLSSPFTRLSSPKQHHPSPSKPDLLGSSFASRVAAESQSPSRRPRRSMELPGFARKLQDKSRSSDGGGGTKAKLQKAEDDHQLRLLHTRHLQWRHANAKATAALSSQRAAAEKALFGAWIAILRVRKSVAIAKIHLHLLRNSYTLMSISRGQMIYLEEWSSLERLYACSLSGTTRALNAAVVRLPVSDGAMADIQALENAVASAMEVMQSIENATSAQLSKLARADSLVSQLCRVVTQELVLMARCRELLSTLASMQVRHFSLKGQMIQLNQTRIGRFQ